MTDSIIAVIRTVVPALAGGISAWLASKNIDLDTGAIVAVLSPLFTGAYYALVRWAEKSWPSVGWLLGYNADLSYSKRPTRV